MFGIYLLIIFFVLLLIYQYFLVEGYTDNEINKKIKDVRKDIDKRIDFINTDLSSLKTIDTDYGTRLKTNEDNILGLTNTITGVKTTSDLFSQKLTQINELTDMLPAIKDLIQNSEEMDDAIEKGEIAAGNTGDSWSGDSYVDAQ
jgi:hypothetical protein